MKSLNFRKIKRQPMTLTLADAEYSENGKDTVLLIKTPTKAMMDELTNLQETLQDATSDDEVTQELYDSCAKIMSRNMTNTVITSDYLSNFFDVEDLFIFFNAYSEFVSEVAGAKN